MLWFQVDEAMWVTEKAIQKAKSEWKEAHALMEDLMFKPQLLTFKAWVWAASTVGNFFFSLYIRCIFMHNTSELTLLLYHLIAYKLKKQISSRTLHIPWDEAGCLCPIGDLFNYDAPGEDLSGIEDIVVDEEQMDFHSQRLTDGGFDEDANAYCLYARANYKKGDQVVHNSWKFYHNC